LQVITTIEDSALALEMLQDRTIEAVLYIPDAFQSSLSSENHSQNVADIQIWFDASRQESDLTENKLTKRLRRYREILVSEELQKRGLPPNLVEPFRIQSVNLAGGSKMAGAVLGMMLPYLIVLLTIVGSTYSAIDLTAGEKERGTMETLLVSPATRLELVLGKFGATMTAGFITAMLAVISLTVTVFAPGSIFSRELGTETTFSMDPAAYLLVFLLLIPVAAFFAAVLIAIAVNARSYKEAQSYVYPVIIISIFPAIASLLPGLENNLKIALIPVVNVSLVLRDAFAGVYEPEMIIMTFLSSFVYAAFAVFIAVRIFQRESVLLRT
jgi:sodium transport system permease protein